MRAETIRFSLCIRLFEGLRSRHSTPVGFADTPSPGGGITVLRFLKQSDKLKLEIHLSVGFRLTLPLCYGITKENQSQEVRLWIPSNRESKA